MELLIFLLIIVLFFTATTQKQDDEKDKVRIIRCHEMDRSHDWTYHPVSKRLTCTKCNYEAGSNE